jgi:hypothetical protein
MSGDPCFLLVLQFSGIVRTRILINVNWAPVWNRRREVVAAFRGSHSAGAWRAGQRMIDSRTFGQAL